MNRDCVLHLTARRVQTLSVVLFVCLLTVNLKCAIRNAAVLHTAVAPNQPADRHASLSIRQCSAFVCFIVRLLLSFTVRLNVVLSHNTGGGMDSNE